MCLSMSDCHDDFLKFSRVVSLTTNEIKKLERSRDAIKRKIVNHFKTKRYETPEFKGQGSFTMGTSIRPIEGFYDLDLGIYLQGLGTDSSRWPKIETIQNLVFHAVEGHTSIRPEKRSACVRVIYKSPYVDKNEISYHIDLPIYAIEHSFWNGTRTMIGLRGDRQWSQASDPQEFTNWFFSRCKENKNDPEQLKRLVKYLKAWKENQPAKPDMPSGMILTVLAAKNYKPDKRDDVAFIETVQTFYNLLEWSFSIKKPTTPKNNLADSMTDIEAKNFMERANKLLKMGKEALESNGPKYTLGRWRQVFGERFMSGDKAKLMG